MIKVCVCCLLQLSEYIYQASKDVCPKRSIVNNKEITPNNVPFTFELITLTDIAEKSTRVDIRSDAYEYQTHLKKYLKYPYYVAKIKGQKKSFAFGSVDFTNSTTLFDGIIYVNGKLHFIEGIKVRKFSYTTLDLAGKSALPEKWGTIKWVEERKYIYYTEDDIEPWSRINDSIQAPLRHDKLSLVRKWWQQVELLTSMTIPDGDTYEWNSNIKKVCSVNVLLDSYFMEKVFRYNIKQAIHEIIILYGSLDFLYRILDFSGIGLPNHFGFQIAKITIDIRHNGFAPKQSGRYLLADKYMKHISSLGLGNDRCLGVSFTFQNLEGVSGQAYQGLPIGGIFVDKNDAIPENENWNVAYVNFMHHVTKGVRRRGSILNTLAHEVGHAFGALHEEDTLCGLYENLLMAAHLREPGRFDNFKFSRCNIKLMRNIIKTRIEKFVKCPHQLKVYDNLVYIKYERWVNTSNLANNRWERDISFIIIVATICFQILFC
ncbi:unnamed protein product [Gordionus sp. m RMFG-2023]